MLLDVPAHQLVVPDGNNPPPADIASVTEPPASGFGQPECLPWSRAPRLGDAALTQLSQNGLRLAFSLLDGCRRPRGGEKRVEAPDFPDWAVGRAWRLAREQDLEPEISPRWFPAWMLLNDAGLARVLAPCRGEEAPDRAFDVMIALLAHPGLDERSIALRRELQAVHPGLLASYLAKLGSAP